MSASAAAATAPAQPSALVIGAGIAGLCCSLALQRAGFAVELLERDVPPPEGGAEEAFFAWQRRGAAQFRHPHAFLGLLCSLLAEHYPELLDDFFAAGARRVDFADMVPPHLLDQYEPAPGDEKLWVLMCRRATMETVLRRFVERQPKIHITNRAYVTGVRTEPAGSALRVTGVELTDRDHNNAKRWLTGDIYVDTTGRASKFPQWLAAAGANIPEEKDDAEIVYYTRHYRLKPGVAEPNRHEHEPFAGDLRYMKYGVFPGENGHFALIVCLPLGETELREAIKDGDNFDAVCRQIPGLVPWIAPESATATTDPFGIGDIKAVWRNFVVDDAPQVLDFFAVGDACARTNPLYGRGCSTGSLHAHLLADVLAEHDDPVERARAFEAATAERIRPIFDASLREDKNGIERANALQQGQELDQASGLKGWFRLAFGDALAAAVQKDIHVFRGMMRTVNLVEKPGAFLEDPRTRRTVFLYMLRGRRRNSQARVQRGPDRRTMLEYIATL